MRVLNLDELNNVVGGCGSAKTKKSSCGSKGSKKGSNKRSCKSSGKSSGKTCVVVPVCPPAPVEQAP